MSALVVNDVVVSWLELCPTLVVPLLELSLTSVESVAKSVVKVESPELPSLAVESVSQKNSRVRALVATTTSVPGTLARIAMVCEPAVTPSLPGNVLGEDSHKR